MDLQSLKTAKFISASQPVYGQQQAQKHLDAALALIDGPRPDSGALQQAAALLIEAMRYHRADIRPRLALAHVYCLLEEEDLALASLQQAQALDPNHPLVEELNDRLDFGAAETPFATRPSRLSEREQAELYERIDHQILTRVLRMSHFCHERLQPAASAEQANLLLTTLLDVRASCQEIHLRLNQISGHPHLPTLRARMRPLETLVHQLEQKFILCGEYRLLQKELESAFNVCCRLESSFAQQWLAGTLEREIELLLRNCHCFADRLASLTDIEQQAPELIALNHCLIDKLADLKERLQSAGRSGLRSA